MQAHSSGLIALLQFCDFLENRLHTACLPLFRRMLRDFFAANDHTLQDFVRLGAQLVLVLPRELKDRNCRVLAAHLLGQQQQAAAQSDPLSRPQRSRCVFEYLRERAATKNIVWLRDMFAQFRVGSDVLLREFVRRGNEAISIIPVDIQADLRSFPPPSLLALPSPHAVPSSRTAPASSVMASSGKRRRELTRPVSSVASLTSCEMADVKPGKASRHEAESTTIGVRGRADLNEIAQGLTGDGAVDAPSECKQELRMRILGAVKRVEALEPWRSVFHDNLRCPFSEAKYPKLTTRLRRFWKHHARAVWERHFWAPLSRQGDPLLHERRKRRQQKAQASFETTVMTHVHAAMGSQFFAGLDEETDPCEGWWYRGRVVDLLIMARRLSERACLRYLELQAFKRFPHAADGSGHRYHTTVNGVSSSMWSSNEALADVLYEICVLKVDKKQERKKADDIELPSVAL